MNEPATVSLDVSGLPCPAPLLGAKKIIDDLQPGQTLCLISDCPGTADDLFAWSKVTGNLVLNSAKQKDGKTAYTIQRAGGAVATPIPHVTLDMRGVSCPGPILEARALLDGMKAGEVLQLVSDCSAAVQEIRTWSQVASIELLADFERARNAHEFYLKKK